VNDKNHGKIKKTVIITGYRCNNNCIFCINSEKRNLNEKTTKQITLEMIEAKKQGRTYLELIGGEPTIRNDFLYLISFAKGLKFKTILIATNGKMFSYPDFAKKTIKAGITSIIFSIHGHNSKLHDRLTQNKGSFEQLKTGLVNLRKLGFGNIGSNTTIVKQNYTALPKIANAILDLGIKNAEFIFVDCTYGGANRNFYHLVPRISKAAPYIKQCLDIGNKNRCKHWHIRYVPMCFFEGYENHISELNEVKTFQTEHLAPDFKNYDVEKSRVSIARVKTEQCSECRCSNRCEGIWKAYIAKYGSDELIAIK